MNVGDIIRTKNCKDDLTGVIVEIINEYAQIRWCRVGMYMPEYRHLSELIKIELKEDKN